MRIIKYFSIIIAVIILGYFSSYLIVRLNKIQAGDSVIIVGGYGIISAKNMAQFYYPCLWLESRYSGKMVIYSRGCTFEYYIQNDIF